MFQRCPRLIELRNKVTCIVLGLGVTAMLFGCVRRNDSQVIVWGDASARGAAIVIDGKVVARSSTPFLFRDGLYAEAPGNKPYSTNPKIELVAPGVAGMTAPPFDIRRGEHEVLVTSKGGDSLRCRSVFGEYASIVVSFARHYLSVESTADSLRASR